MAEHSTVVVVSDPRDGEGLDALVLHADAFLAGAPAVDAKARIVNLCRNHAYLSRGYYVSLLAEARGHEVVPTVHTLEAMADPHARVRALQEAGVDVLDRREIALRLRALPEQVPAAGGDPLPPILDRDDDERPFYRMPRPDEVAEVLVGMGHTADPRFRRIAQRVWSAWPAPLLRMSLVLEEEVWVLFELRAEAIGRLGPAERGVLQLGLKAPRPQPPERAERRGPSLAILYEETDPYRASTPDTIDRIERIAQRMGLRAQRLGIGDLRHLADHDALFIRTLTGLDQPAWRFATRAEALGMPVIDDPQSIVRCSNKLYLYELLRREGLATPATMVVTRQTTWAELSAGLGEPVVVKVPDGSFSAAVFKIQSQQDYDARVPELLRRSPLLVAQEFIRTDYDWRVTVLDGRVLFVCRYHMVPGHWQIRSLAKGRVRYGRVEALPRDRAPREVARLATNAARLVGEGMYGVDIKEGPDGPMVIEVNDNPNLDVGYDDTADGDRVFEDLVQWFLRRIPRDRAERESLASRPKHSDDALAALTAPIGRVPSQPSEYRAWEVMGLEVEYPIVDRDLNAQDKVEELLGLMAGRPTSDVDLGVVGLSNEIMQHVLELKHAIPLRSVARGEEVLFEGVRRVTGLLAARMDARLLPCGMHPWFDPKKARLWERSNKRTYDTYARLFDVRTHGWANVQAVHVNLPLGRDDEAVAMMAAARLLVPYLPALAASSPMYDGELQPAVDNRLAFIIEHQARLPESSGDIVPEPIRSLAGYKRDVLGRMYKAVDRLPDSEPIRHEFLNARGAVFKFSRNSMELRVLDVQECVHADVAIATFARRALRMLAKEIAAGAHGAVPQDDLVADFRKVVWEGGRARVRAPFLQRTQDRDADGLLPAHQVLGDLLERCSVRAPKEERPYLDTVSSILQQGSLSERIAAALLLHVGDADRFTEEARRVWVDLSQCLVENRLWSGRQHGP
jgi:glutathione synthase/RimK-type ligase-like ATP-grasp enzyme/gamma-glutamyl:cysteine ligase YbdK (ATP-grasp superfamily)